MSPLMNQPLLHLVLIVALLLLRPSHSLSSSSSQHQPPRRPSSPLPSSSKYPFLSFEFDPSTGICRNPSSFRYTTSNNNKASVDEDEDDSQFFVLRNVPGDGDCIFHAVLSSVFISMGFMNPDATFVKSDTLVSSMALEMRHVVAKFLSSPEGVLYVNNKPVKRIVRCRDLLSSAAKNEGLSPDEYLMRLRQPGKKGGLYGGGPELTCLSNILRRPISIYHLKQQQSQEQQQISTANNTTASTATTTTYCELERMGVFGEGLFEDPCQSIPDSVISNAVFFTVDGSKLIQQTQSSLSTTTTVDDASSILNGISSPLKCSWHLHVLIADSGNNEKHASVLLPSVSILHNEPQRLK
mmetsp:Transcript_27283/g.41998  ORF Transcript_27283/g.41998 Transcript_27283/m.41998 type:complete len:354 (+) Transcript_27283:155-1216(+)